MLKILATLNALLTPLPHSAAVSDVIGSDRTVIAIAQNEGASTAARLLTRQDRWSVVAQSISKGHLALTRSDLRELLNGAPERAIPSLRLALRTRMSHNLLEGLSLLSPAITNPFNGEAVCRGASREWRQQLRTPLSQLHDIRVTFQQKDCLRGLGAPNLS